MKTKVKYNSKYLIEVKKILLKHFNENLKDYLILSIIFILGVISGVILINNSNEQSKSEINGYINSFISTIKEKEFEIDKVKLMKTSIFENIKNVITIWVAGTTIIGIPLIFAITAYKGFCIGYTISAIISSLGVGKGIAFSLASLFLQNIIIIPVILMLNVSALKLYKTLVKDSKNKSIKSEIIRHTMLCIVLIIPLIIASVIEAYLSSSLICLYN